MLLFQIVSCSFEQIRLAPQNREPFDQKEVKIVTRPYELLYVLNPEIGEEKLEAVTARFEQLIADNGTVDDVDVWGRRHLAYEINDLTEGYYVLVHFSSDPEFPLELERQLKISEDVIRYLVTRVGE